MGASSNITNRDASKIVTITNAGTTKKALDVNIANDETGLVVTNALEFTAFDLNAAAFSKVTNITNDYIFDSIELNFSTTESKTITITSANGTVLLGGTLDTSSSNFLRNTTKQSFNLKFDQAFDGGENITVDVTQFSSAGTMDCILKIKQGSASLTGEPVIGAGTNEIGSVNVIDVSDADPQIFEDTSFVAGDSPITLDVNAALGRNGTQFFIFNDGAGDFTVALSRDGAAFGDEHTVKNGETYSIDNYSVDSIRITHVANSSYRVVVL